MTSYSPTTVRSPVSIRAQSAIDSAAEAGRERRRLVDKKLETAHGKAKTTPVRPALSGTPRPLTATPLQPPAVVGSSATATHRLTQYVAILFGWLMVAVMRAAHMFIHIIA